MDNDVREALIKARKFFDEQLDADIDAHIPPSMHDLNREDRRAEMLRREGSLEVIADLEDNLTRINAALARPRVLAGPFAETIRRRLADNL